MCEQLRKALQDIVDYNPEWEAWEHPEPDCDECALARKRQWPPSRLCDPHYSSLARNSNANKRRVDNQWMLMKQIAQDALDAATAPEGTAPRG